MSSVNKVIILGNVGQDPETRHLENGNQVSHITVATTESWKDKEGKKQETTEWHDVELWNGLSKIVDQYVKKGDKIYIEGKIKTDKFTDKDGVERRKTKIKAVDLTLLGAKKQEGSNRSESPAKTQKEIDEILENENMDDLPF